MQRTHLFVGGLLSVFLSTVSLATQFSIVDMGVAPGSTIATTVYSRATALNDEGIAVGYQTNTDGRILALQFQTNGTVLDLGITPLPGQGTYPQAYANDVAVHNSTGDLYRLVNVSQFMIMDAILKNNQPPVHLNGCVVYGEKITSSGFAIGGEDHPGAILQGAIWNPDGTMHRRFGLPNRLTMATAVAEVPGGNLWIGGWANATSDPYSPRHALRYNYLADRPSLFAEPPGTYESLVTAILPNGVAAGQYAPQAPASGGNISYLPILFVRGTYRLLPTLPEFNQYDVTSAAKVGTEYWIVGTGYPINWQTQQPEALLWRVRTAAPATATVERFSQMLAPGNPWLQLINAADINSSGQIVGYGQGMFNGYWLERPYRMTPSSL